MEVKEQRKKETTHHRVLRLLCNRWPGGATLEEIRDPEVGGSAGDVRMREIERDKGIPFTWEWYENPRTGDKTHLTVYKLDMDPKFIDIDNLCIIKPDHGQQTSIFNEPPKPQIDFCPVCGGVIGRGGIGACVC